jgi:hypothetical protein
MTHETRNIYGLDCEASRRTGGHPSLTKNGATSGFKHMVNLEPEAVFQPCAVQRGGGYASVPEVPIQHVRQRAEDIPDQPLWVTEI